MKWGICTVGWKDAWRELHGFFALESLERVDVEDGVLQVGS